MLAKKPVNEGGKGHRMLTEVPEKSEENELITSIPLKHNKKEESPLSVTFFSPY